LPGKLFAGQTSLAVTYLWKVGVGQGDGGAQKKERDQPYGQPRPSAGSRCLIAG
jgi:hypothetical protein